MKKENLIGVILVIAIIVIVFLIVLFSGSEKKDIEVNVLDIEYENNQYFVNISLKNNQDKTGWISNTYLETVEGNIIDLTGAGIDEKVNPGETNYLQLFSADVIESITNPPFTLSYTVFPSGKSYSVEI
jgi:hypothetical protein